MTILAARRIPLYSKPEGAFAYVLITDETKSLQIGLGHESKSGLNLTHIMAYNIKPGFVYEVADAIEKGTFEGNGLILKTGRLGDFFDGAARLAVTQALLQRPIAQHNGASAARLPVGGQPDGLAEARDGPPLAVQIAAAMREIHDEVWGNPRDWCVEMEPFGDGRLAWIAYDSTIDKIRIGIGYYDDTNFACLGDQSFAIGARMAGDFAVDCWTSPKPLLFYALPPRWPKQLSQIVGHGNKQKVAKLFLKLADEVWPGKVQTTDRRPLTQEEILSLNGGPAHQPVRDYRNTAAQEVLDKS